MLKVTSVWGAVAGMLVAVAGGQAQTRSVWDGVYTTEQAVRGAELYEESCAECHGVDLGGGEMAPGLVGGEFVWTWSGLPVAELFERLRVSMPQVRPNSVSRAEKAAILAYMFDANGFPAGDTELADRAAPLRGILFSAEQP